MEPGARVLLVTVLASVAAPTAFAGLMAAGPYAIDVTEFGPCDDGEYPGIIFNISLVLDEETEETFYRGDITTTYAFLADECEITITSYKWGNGWSQIYFLNYTKPFDYTKENFPVVFELLLDDMGMNEKPVPAGTYHMQNFMPRRFTLKKFSALPYGTYKMYAKGIKDGETLLCLMGKSKVYEAENTQPKAGGFKKF